MLVEFPADKTVIQEGGFSNDFYAIESGTAKVERGGEQIAELGPGDVFGEQGLLERQERSASVVATTPMRALKIEHWEIPRMRKAMPEVLDHLKETIEKRSAGG
jgi:CRP-like cAMP-binding protein